MGWASLITFLNSKNTQKSYQLHKQNKKKYFYNFLASSFNLFTNAGSFCNGRAIPKWWILVPTSNKNIKAEIIKTN
jgi:hypothetical protein